MFGLYNYDTTTTIQYYNYDINVSPIIWLPFFPVQ